MMSSKRQTVGAPKMVAAEVVQDLALALHLDLDQMLPSTRHERDST